MSTDLIFSVEKHLGLITLNRPQALHALTQTMIQDLSSQLHAWAQDDEIHAVIIRASESRAFCAGGDVRRLYELGLQEPEAPLPFFKDEYRLNYLIAHYPKPYIPLLNGFTFGGGVGISLHSPYAIASEDFVFSMPETGIGFFPDIGASHLLSKCTGAYGLYLGLTGARLNAKNALMLTLVRAVIPTAAFDMLIHALLDTDLSKNSAQKIDNLIQNHRVILETDLDDKDDINQCFDAPSIAQIYLNLQQTKTSWAKTTQHQLEQKSPTSLAVTFEQFKRAKNKSLADCLARDYTLAYHFMQHQDFFEGVRALLIDKDKNPRWSDKYGIAEVDAYFNHPQHIPALIFDDSCNK